MAKTKSTTRTNARTNTDEPRPTPKERSVDAAWSIGTNVVSGLLIAVTVWGVGQVTGVNDRIFADRDCTDFTSQADAQRLLDADPTDPHRLDLDGDGEACESLP
ncbi:excalibur calcium-binding domain-containing protein [Pimelobacter simplex]|uniref:excalibur calcium-binding domain-containing protein n=1 Tax=Nocardioides simplex TaxID=2045 RepID=UPI0021502014|nr:excalibur calcium-binding domain-containing protein [Pimelobacter simplex]UUW90593.1 excalibur calcium-binding domain-containing protein [Pimelobacter simplex]UUW94422.1 excalibur calcium-binding domain-containing protein [Pimelobacter simplex]